MSVVQFAVSVSWCRMCSLQQSGTGPSEGYGVAAVLAEVEGTEDGLVEG